MGIFKKDKGETVVNEKILIAVDAGKYMTKAMAKNKQGQVKQLSFRTKILNDTNDYEVIGNSFKIEFEGQKYIIGEQGEEVSYDVSKSNDTHILALYTAISQLIEYSGQTVQLVFGTPCGIYTDKTNRDEYKQKILKNGRIKIKVNKIDYEFNLENVLLLPESSGVVYVHSTLFKNKRVAVINLGGLNMNFAIYDNFVPELSSMFNINLGSYNLEKEVMKALNNKYGIDLNERDVQRDIRQGYMTINGQTMRESVNIINNAIDKFIAKIDQETKKYGYNLSTLDVVVDGGTSLLLEKAIKKFIPHVNLVSNAQWTNAEGFLKVGELKYGN